VKAEKSAAEEELLSLTGQALGEVFSRAMGDGAKGELVYGIEVVDAEAVEVEYVEEASA
jgi:hypothetical protein